MVVSETSDADSFSFALFGLSWRVGVSEGVEGDEDMLLTLGRSALASLKILSPYEGGGSGADASHPGGEAYAGIVRAGAFPRPLPVGLGVFANMGAEQRQAPTTAQEEAQSAASRTESKRCNRSTFVTLWKFTWPSTHV